MLSFPPSPGFEIFRVWRMQREVESEPQHFRVADEPHSEKNRDGYHYGERRSGVAKPKHIVEDRPGPKGGHDGEGITDGDVRKEVSAFAHKEVSAGRTSCRAVEVALE